LDANEAVPVSSAKISTSQPPPALEPPAPAAAPLTQAAATVAPPPLPDLYLQVAGPGSRKDASFVKGLQAEGYRARIIMSTTASTTESAGNQADSQILIGPFAGPRSLEIAKRKLQAAGVQAIEIAH
jgi:cell division protein FtsN